MPSPQQNVTNIPSNRVEIIDSRTGLVSREWYRFFLNIFNLAGSGGNQTSLDDLQIGPPPQPSTSSGTGTVTSVDVSGGTTGLTTSGGPVTTSGTITLAGTLAVANGGTGLTTTPANGALDIGNGTGFTRTTLTAGTGVAITNASGSITIASSVTPVTSVTGTSPVVSSGGTTPAISLAASYGDTQNPYAAKTANYFLAAPNGSAGAPAFRAVVVADIPTLNQNTTGTASNVTGIVAVTNGGSGTATPALVAGTNVTITGSWPNQTINSSNTGGTVTSVAATVPSFLSVTGSPITTSGTLAISYSGTALPILNGGTGQTTASTAFNALSPITTLGDLIYGSATNTNSRLAGNTTATKNFLVQTGTGTVSAAPSWGSIAAADVPTLNQNTTGSAATLTTGRTIAITGDLAYTSPSFNGSANVTAAGTLATVNLNVGSFTNATLTVNGKGLITAASSGTAPVTSVTGTSPVVSSGGATPAISLAASYGDTQNPYASKTANFVLAAPNGLAGVPTFRAIVAADIPTLNQNTTGTASNITATSNSTLTTLSVLSLPGSQVSGNISGNAANVTGTVAVANGGTGLTTTPANGALDIGNGTGFTRSTLTAGSGISVTNAAGAITIANTSPSSGGTVTSVAALTLGTTGTDLSSSVANSTTTPVITLNVPTASATNRGALSSADWTTFNNKGSGTVTAVSVVSANGFAGTSSGGATPALTLSTTITGVLKGNATAISAATSGTDYSAGTSALTTGILKSTTTTGALSIAIAGDFPTLNQNTTGSAATLTTPRAIYGNNFNGSAALTQIIASTYGGTGNGFTKFSGATTAEKTYSLPDATTTILTTNAAVTIAQGGTGQTTATLGFNALAPSQTANSGKYLTTDGTNTSWATVASSSNTNAFAFAWFIR